MKNGEKQSSQESDREAVFRMIDEGLTPIEPGPQLRQRMRSMVLASIHKQRVASPSFVAVHRGSGTWKALSKGVSAKPLAEINGRRSFLVQFNAGTALPAHRHFETEECFVLAGALEMGRLTVAPLTYHVAPSGSRHARVHAREDSLIYLRGTCLDDSVSMLRDMAAAWWPSTLIDNFTTSDSQEQWERIAPGIAKKALWESSAVSAMLLRIEPGTEWSPIVQGAYEELIVLEGDAQLEDLNLTVGDYYGSQTRAERTLAQTQQGVRLFARYDKSHNAGL